MGQTLAGVAWASMLAESQRLSGSCPTRNTPLRYAGSRQDRLQRTGMLSVLAAGQGQSAAFMGAKWQRLDVLAESCAIRRNGQVNRKPLFKAARSEIGRMFICSVSPQGKNKLRPIV
jgi:hypothetical protein